MTKLHEMLAVIARQRHDTITEALDSPYTLASLTDAQLVKVQAFITSFYADPITGALPEKGTRTMPTRKERLAALEIAQQLNQERIADLIVTVGKLTTGVERLTDTILRTQGVVDKWADHVIAKDSLLAEMSQRVDHAERKLNELTTAFALHNNAVVDGQAILGREQAALAARLDKLERLSEPQVPQPFVWPHWPTGEWREGDPPPQTTPFPAGAATTVDEVLAAVPPADDGPPRRGDRVRLEGALSTGGFSILNGWYDVVGFSRESPIFQVTSDGRALFWLYNDAAGVKEIRRSTAQPQRPAIEPVDDKDIDV